MCDIPKETYYFYLTPLQVCHPQYCAPVPLATELILQKRTSH